jgi:K+/H+ antiporter YhaU regulatory subunit KhtT
MTLRQTTLARREAEIVAREKRAMELVRVARRHREEAEELIKRHREEIDEVFKNEK